MKKNWLKLLIVAMLAVILITALVACNGNKNPQQSNPADYSAYAGKYYEARGDKLLANSWIELKSDGTWTDDDGESGQFYVSGNKVSFNDGGFEFEGTLQNGTLSVDILGEVTVYKQGTPGIEPEPGETTKYTVTFVLDPNDEYEEEEIEPQEYEADEVMSDLPIPERDGFNFVEWRSSDGKIYSRSSIMPAQNLILTARWEEKVSTYEDDYVTFKPAAQGKKHDNNWYWDYNSYGIDKYIYVELTSEDLGGMSQVGEENNFRLTELDFSVKSGYQWTWYKDDFSTPNGTQRFTLKYGSNIQFVTAQDGAGNVQAIYLVDIYVLHDYKIELYKNVYEYGTSANPYDSFYVVEGNRIPDDIEKYTNYGYTPAGFVHYVENRNTDTMDEVSFGLDTVIKQDYKLYQTYEVAEIEAELADGAFADGEKLQAKPFAEYQQLAVPTKEGFDFIGWKMSNGKYFADITGFTATNYLSTAVTKLTAEWRAKQLFEVWEGDEVTFCETVPYVTYTDATHNAILEIVYSPKGYDCALPTVVDENSYFDHWEEYKYDSVKNEYNSAYIQFGGELTSPRAMHAKTMSDFTSEDTTRGIPLNSMRTFTNNSIDKYRVNLPTGLEESKDFVLCVEGNLVITRDKFGSGPDTQLAQSYTVNGTKDIEIDTCGYTGLSFTIGNVSGSFKLGLYGPTAATTGQPAVGETIGVGDTLVAEERLGYNFDGWFCENEKVSEEDSLKYTVKAEDEGKTFEKKYTVNPELANFVFDCDSTTLTITGVKDNTVKELVVPSYVTSIAKGAFSECSQLESITMPFVGDGNKNAFFGYIFGGSSYNDNDSVVPACLFEVKLTGCENIAANAFRYVRSITSVTIPESVKSIGSDAFSGCYKLVHIRNLSKVTISSSSASNDGEILTDAESNFANKLATDNNGIQTYTVGDVVYAIGYVGDSTTLDLSLNSAINAIYPYAFYNNIDITILTISNSVTDIGNNAFYGCTSLASVNWNATNCTTAGRDFSPIFEGCTQLATVNIGDSVQSIPSYTFKGCTGLQTVIIGSDVTIIGRDAFYNCTDITRVNYLGDLKGWCEIKFDNFNAKSYYSNPLYVANVNKAGTAQLYLNDELVTDVKDLDGLNYIPAYSFCGLADITSVTITDSVTIISPAAFSGCTNISTATMPANAISYIPKDSLTTVTITSGEISYGAFRSFTGLQTVTISGSVTSIGTEAFYCCTGLQTVTIGGSVTSIGTDAFYGCTGLQTVTIGEGVQSIGSSAFSGCTGLKSVTIGKNVQSIGAAAFYDCTNIARVNYLGTLKGWCEITFNVSHMVTHGFSGYSNPLYAANKAAKLYLNDVEVTGEVQIPAGTKRIGDYAFSRLTDITSVTIQDSVTSIGEYAFHECTGLQTVTISGSVQSIGADAFNGCTGLQTVTIGEGVQSIGADAFFDCRGLKSVTIGSDVTSIGDSAFANCGGITKVNYLGDLKGWCEIEFEDTSANPLKGNAKLYVKENGVEKEVTGNVQIPEGTTKIGSYAFYGLKCITSVVIPDSVTSIGEYAFANCTGLKNIYYAGSSQQWQDILKGSFWDEYDGGGSWWNLSYTMHYDYTGPAAASLVNADNLYNDGSAQDDEEYWHYNDDPLLPTFG